jgi:hypothetical protein
VQPRKHYGLDRSERSLDQVALLGFELFLVNFSSGIPLGRISSAVSDRCSRPCLTSQRIPGTSPGKTPEQEHDQHHTDPPGSPHPLHRMLSPFPLMRWLLRPSRCGCYPTGDSDIHRRFCNFPMTSSSLFGNKRKEDACRVSGFFVVFISNQR